MKTLLCLASLIAATAQPALAASCWSSPDGSRLMFPPVRTAVTYTHNGVMEPCEVIDSTKHEMKVWCDISSVTGVAYFMPRWHSPSGRSEVIWDGQTFYRDSACW
jgi:hypothetical protein